MNQMFSTVSSFFFSRWRKRAFSAHSWAGTRHIFVCFFFLPVIFAAQPLRLSPFFIVFIGIKVETMETKKGLH